jgi:hypothetical protein
MKKLVPSIAIVLLSISSLNAQSDRFTQDFQPIRAELTKWDPIRGEWLASSMLSIAKKEPIPDRTFPENFTPAEMMKMVPESNRTAIQKIASTNTQNADSSSRVNWNSINTQLSRPSCKPVQGRTYGDPHLSSFDGASYSFQTVGEFVLMRSASQNMEIQARQQPQSDDFSLNTALAMNVGGDRICIYANEKPDNISNCALRLNGSPLYITSSVYYLPHGGTIRYSMNDYVVTWPTGEVATIDVRRSSQMNFLNVSVQVYPCAQNDLEGLLGNANGSQNDDFDVRGNTNRPAYMAFSSFGSSQMQQASNDMEKEYLAFLARDYARQFRVTPITSLFDYGIGQSTFTYTDESFPRVHRTVNDLSPDRQTAARVKCEENGIRGDELKGCIFDQAYLEIPPSPRPLVVDRTNNIVLSRIDRPVNNVNGGNVTRETVIPTSRDNGQPQPIQQNPETNRAKPVGAEVNLTNGTLKPSISTKPTSVESNPTVEKPIEFEMKPTSTKPTNTKPAGIEVKPSSSKPSGSGTTTPVNTTPVKTTPTMKGGKG